jgi:sulfonate transport system permease protein
MLLNLWKQKTKKTGKFFMTKSISETAIGIAIKLIVPLAILALWQIGIDNGALPHSLIASPMQTATDFFKLLFNGELETHITVSVSRLLAGFIIGTIIGIAIGIIVGVSKIAENLLLPTIKVFSPIPTLAWIPVLIILFNIGEASKIALIVCGVAPIVFLGTFEGIRSADRKLVELALVYKKNVFELTKKILLPGAMPNIFTGLKIALALSWVLLIAAELIASSSGLGWLIWDARNFARADDMIVGIITIGICGLFSEKILEYFEKKALIWRRTFSGQ